VVISGRSFVDGGVGKNFTFSAEAVKGLGFASAGRANVAGRENFIIAMRADFTDQTVPLLLETPMAWDFHLFLLLGINAVLISPSLILSSLPIRNYQAGWNQVF
jgi:hypothetical protein